MLLGMKLRLGVTGGQDDSTFFSAVSHTANTLELTNAADRWCVDWQNVNLAAVEQLA